MGTTTIIPENINTNKSGLAGEFAVLSRLYKEGFDASISLNNTKGFDIFVQNPNSKTPFLIEVKTTLQRDKYVKSKKDFWGNYQYWKVDNVLDRKEDYKGRKIFFCFVFFGSSEDKKYPDYPYIYVVPADKVIEYLLSSKDVVIENNKAKGEVMRIGNGSDKILSKQDYFNRFDLLKGE
ncbi:MAG: hypothetical protein FWF35_04190 [Elusimicrobia bacterium]|nr:hypothetical protein [Elusimicrobiota bacterium]